MRRGIRWMMLVLCLGTFTAWGALLFEEHFSSAPGFIAGTAPGIGGTWIDVATSGTNPNLIVTGTLAAPSGFAAATGNKAHIGRISGPDTTATFASQSTGTVYYSLLLNMNNLSTSHTTVGLSLSNTAEYATLNVNSSNGMFRLGVVGRSGGSVLYSTNWFPSNSTVLAVLSYTFVSGSKNDQVQLWINPVSFGGAAPAADVTVPAGFTDTTALNTIELDNSSSINDNTYVDEIRIGTAWADVTPVQMQDQTITFPNPGSKVTTDTVTLSAAASSGLAVTYGVVSGPAALSGSNVTFTGNGTVTLSANQTGDARWNPAPQTNVTFTVTKAPATVTLSNTNQIYDGTARSVTADTVPSGLTVDVTYNGSANPPVNLGSYAVVATVNSAMYQGSASGTLVISSGLVDVRALSTGMKDVWTNGRVEGENILHYVGRRSSTYGLTANVMSFLLPDLKGASIVSAKLKFNVTAVSSLLNATNDLNLNVEAIRSYSSGSITSNDYRGLGLRTNEVLIQAAVARWDDGGWPRTYKTSGAATNTLGTWLAQQYAGVGTAGRVLLRLAPDQDVAGSRAQMTVPTESVELIITTDGNINSSGFGTTVSAQIGPHAFSWTLDQNVQWGHFIDGQPWVVMPPSGYLSLVSVSPARKNNQTVNIYGSANTTNADIDITVINPPFTHTFNTNTMTYVDNTNGVFGWDSRAGSKMDGTASPRYNPALGWNGTTWQSLSVGDSITTAKSTVENPMVDRATPLDALAVLTVLSAVPPADAFRPGIIRSGTDRTNPEILCYSNMIDLTSYLIPSPVGGTDLRGTNVTSMDLEYTFDKIAMSLPGPGFKNIGYSQAEGASARYNNWATAGGDGQYGGTLGNHMGKLAVGSLAAWLTPEQRKVCQIQLIQRAIDSYSAVKAGLCLEEGAGMLPGYSQLITVAGVMMNHTGMKDVNKGMNGVMPWWIFADYATCWHTGGVSTNDLAVGETPEDRLIAIYDTSAARPEFNRTNIQPIAVAAANTMTMKTNFYWGKSRPMNNIIGLKVRITGGTGAGSTIYVITNSIVSTNLLQEERFRKEDGTTYTNGNVFGFLYGGKVNVNPAWQNGIPDSNSVVAFSITTSDTSNPYSDDASWYWEPDGVLPEKNPVRLQKQDCVGISPNTEYSSVFAGGASECLVALYALGQQNLYKGGLDKYMIEVGSRPGYDSLFDDDTYFDSIGTGTNGNVRGALWKQEVLSAVGADYIGGGAGSLAVPNASAKMFYEP